jgi:ABC-type polar amino acid transport system ATPase subunit
MDEGEIIEIAKPKDLFNNPQSERTKKFLKHIL